MQSSFDSPDYGVPGPCFLAFVALSQAIISKALWLTMMQHDAASQAIPSGNHPDY
jgi:hypothetical protein